MIFFYTSLILQVFFTLFSSFYSRGDNGPQLFMSDDDSKQIKALHTVYPNATVLLCLFHILQAVWRWLWDSHHHVEKKDRPHHLSAFNKKCIC